VRSSLRPCFLIRFNPAECTFALAMLIFHCRRFGVLVVFAQMASRMVDVLMVVPGVIRKGRRKRRLIYVSSGTAFIESHYDLGRGRSDDFILANFFWLAGGGGFKKSARKAGLPTALCTTCAAHVHVSASLRVANRSRSSFCLGMSQSKRQNGTSEASSGFAAL
jgi:hypothetical protein